MAEIEIIDENTIVVIQETPITVTVIDETPVVEINTGITSVSWDDVLNKPLTFTPSEHDHNSLYYGKSDIDTYLSGKANSNHNHDSSYAILNHNHDSAYAVINHNHDSAYAVLNHTHSDYSLTTHNHDSVYAALSHTHSDYALTSHNHDSAYAILNHNHDSSYAVIAHTHSDYALTSHNHDAAYAALSHAHDDRYYTESEIDTMISGVSGALPIPEYGFVKSSADSNNIYTVVTYYVDSVRRRVSTLSGGTSPEYTTNTVTYYASDGTTVTSTITYTLTYDAGVLISEVRNA